MAELLKRWLHEEVGVSFQVHNFEKQFSNGFFLGEVLYRCNLQPDFEMFENSDNPDAMVNNFTRIQPVLSRLGIAFDARLANAIMTEDRDVSAKLLYTIKSKLDAMRNTMQDSRRVGTLAKTLTIESAPSRALVEVQAGKSIKAKYDQSRFTAFEDQLRQSVANPNTLMETLHLRKFTETMSKQMEEAHRAKELDTTAAQQARMTFRSELLSHMDAQRDTRHKFDVKQRKAHHKVVLTRRANEKHDLAVELTLYEGRERKKQEVRAMTVADVSAGIESFESNLTRLGTESLGVAKDGPGGRGPDAAPHFLRPPPSEETPLDTIRHIRSIVPEVGALGRQSDAYLAAIRLRRRDELQARREREARRMKVLVDQQKALDESQYEASLSSLRESLSKRSEDELELSARLSQLEAEEAVLREDRVLREAQYADRGERDTSEALQRETIALIAAKGRYGEAAAAQMALLREAKERRKVEKRRIVKDLCREAVLGLVGLAERCGEYRASLDAMVPRSEFRKWVAMFVAGSPDILPKSIPEDFVEPEAPNPNAEAGYLQLLKTTAIEDYLTGTGEWEGTGRDPPPAPLCHAVGDIFRRAELDRLPSGPAGPPNLASVPIKLAVTGAPFSGKTTLAAKLARHFHLRVIDPHKLVQEAVAAAQNYIEPEAPPEAEPSQGVNGEEGEGEVSPPAPPPAPETPELVLIGRECLDVLGGGGEVGDGILSRLAVWAIRDTAGQMNHEPMDLVALAAPLEAAGGAGVADTKKAPAKGAKKDPKKDAKGPAAASAAAVPDDHPTYYGFVLDGFPATVDQAVLLERSLTGLDLDKEAEDAKRASLIAPPPHGVLPDPARPLRSGLDAIVALSLLDSEVAVKRGQGRRIDPQTGTVYHLEWNPPPAQDPGLMERLVEDPGDSNDVPQLEQRLLTHSEAASPLLAWLCRFVTLTHEVRGEEPMETAIEAARGVVLGGLTAKEARDKTAEAARACEDARVAAEEARLQGEAAKKASESAAMDLFRAKLAEVQAAETLHKKGVDVAATELLKQQAADTCANALKAATDASKQAGAAAAAAQEALAAAEEAFSRCEASLDDATGLASAQEAALSHAKAAMASLDAARKAAEVAAAGAAAAGQSLDRAQRAAAGEEVEEMKELASAANPAPPVKGKPAAKGGKEEKGKAVAEPTPIASLDPSKTDVAPPYEPPAMSPEAASEQWAQWTGIEANYLQALEKALAALRGEREEAATHFIRIRRDFVAFLHAPDAKRGAAEDLWAELQRQGHALLSDAAVNADALQRVGDLRDRLWEMCDAKMKDSEQRKAQVQGAPFVAQQSERLTALYIDLVQAELQRLFATVAFVQRAPKLKYGLGYTSAKPIPDVPSIKDGAGTGEFAAAVKAVPATPWLDELAKPNPKLFASGKLALAACDVAGAVRIDVDPASIAGAAPELVAILQAEDEEAREAVAKEAAATRSRIDSLFRKLLSQVRETKDLSDRTVQRLDEWLKRRYHGEVGAVSELAASLKQALQGLGEATLGGLRYEGDSFERETISIGVLGAAAARLDSLSEGRDAVAVGDAAEALHDALSAPDGRSTLPPHLAAASPNALSRALASLDWTGSGQVGRRDVMAALLCSVFPRLAAAAPAVFKDARRQLEAADGDSDGRLTRAEFLAVPLWFQRTTQEHLELQAQLTAPPVDAKGGKGAKAAAKPAPKPADKDKGKKAGPAPLVDLAALEAAAMDKYNASAALKELVFDSLSMQGVDGPLLDISTLLLAFSWDKAGLKEGLLRATASVGAEDPLSVTAAQLERIATGVTAASAGQTGSADAFAAVARDKGADPSVAATRVLIDELLASEAEAAQALVQGALSRYHLSDLVERIESEVEAEAAAAATGDDEGEGDDRFSTYTAETDGAMPTRASAAGAAGGVSRRSVVSIAASPPRSPSGH